VGVGYGEHDPLDRRRQHLDVAEHEYHRRDYEGDDEHPREALGAPDAVREDGEAYGEGERRDECNEHDYAEQGVPDGLDAYPHPREVDARQLRGEAESRASVVAEPDHVAD